MRRILGAALVMMVTGTAGAEERTLRPIFDDLVGNTFSGMSGVETDIPEDEDRDYYVFSRCAGLMTALVTILAANGEEGRTEGISLFSEAAALRLWTAQAISDLRKIESGGHVEPSERDYVAEMTERRSEMTERYVSHYSKEGYPDDGIMARDLDYCMQVADSAADLVKKSDGQKR